MKMANAKRDFKYEFEGLSDLLLSESGNVLFKCSINKNTRVQT
jgi:hypothetical protein